MTTRPITAPYSSHARLARPLHRLPRLVRWLTSFPGWKRRSHPRNAPSLESAPAGVDPSSHRHHPTLHQTPLGTLRRASSHPQVGMLWRMDPWCRNVDHELKFSVCTRSHSFPNITDQFLPSAWLPLSLFFCDQYMCMLARVRVPQFYKVHEKGSHIQTTALCCNALHIRASSTWSKYFLQCARQLQWFNSLRSDTLKTRNVFPLHDTAHESCLLHYFSFINTAFWISVEW